LRAFARASRHHLGRHVDADHFAGRADRARREEAIEATACAEIEHGLARTQGRDRLWVAAAEAHVGALGQRGQLVGRIAEHARLIGAGMMAQQPGAHPAFPVDTFA
jgi:hypothetical protein